MVMTARYTLAGNGINLKKSKARPAEWTRALAQSYDTHLVKIKYTTNPTASLTIPQSNNVNDNREFITLYINDSLNQSQFKTLLQFIIL